MHGPPAYFTPDLQAAGTSVRTLDDLAPDILLIGHAKLAQGPGMAAALARLAAEFDRVAVPHGRMGATPMAQASPSLGAA